MGYRAIIREIRKKNFRSIVEATIPLDNFNIFVGLNDCGKSNVLKALNLFFNGETEAGHSLDFKRDYCQHGRTGKGKAKEIVIEVSIQVPEEFSEAGIKKWKKVWRDNKLHEDNFTTLFRQYSKCATLFSRIHFEYIPAVKSDVFFQELLLKLYYSMVASADGKLAKVNQDYSKALAELTVNLHESVKSQIGLDSKIKMPDQMSALFRNLKISTSDSNIKNIDINHRGDGIKARHIPSILVTIAYDVDAPLIGNSVTVRLDYKYWDVGIRNKIEELLTEGHPTIKDINQIETSRGRSPNSDSYVDEDEGFAVVIKAGSNISRFGTLTLADADWIEKSVYDEYVEKANNEGTNLNLVQQGDVLLASTGDGTLGKACVYDAAHPAIADGHVTIIRVDTKKIDPYYLADYLRYSFGSLQVNRLFTGSTGLIELTPEQVDSIVIELPVSVDDQKSISTQIRSLEARYNAMLFEAKELLTQAQQVIK